MRCGFPHITPQPPPPHLSNIQTDTDARTSVLAVYTQIYSYTYDLVHLNFIQMKNYRKANCCLVFHIARGSADDGQMKNQLKQ